MNWNLSSSLFLKTKALCYSEHKHGFYVYEKSNLCDLKTVIKYIVRYLDQPVIDTSRINNYDCNYVTLHYNRHEDNKYMKETIPTIEFIKNLSAIFLKNIFKRFAMANYITITDTYPSKNI